jgi:hypothetical protein
MLTKSVGILICILFLIVACSAAPPVRHTVSHDPALSRQEGVLLLADACIQKDAIGEAEDFFVVAESKYAAQTILKTLRGYVADSNIPIRAEIAVVCAARHGVSESILVGDHINAQPHRAPQPLYVQENIVGDKEFIKAISTVSTYTFERAATDNKENNESPDVNKLTFLNAAGIIKSRTNASSILFLGVLGTSVTGAKAVTQGISSFVVGMVTAVATAGLGTGYYASFMPGRQIDGRFMEGALVDLESGELTWSNAVKASGDPIDKETWSDLDPLDLLFHDLLFQSKVNQ